MVDVQNRRDGRMITLDEAGIRDLLYPVTILDRERDRQRTVARISMSVELPHHFKGTHMSRFMEVLGRHDRDFDGRTIPAILEELKRVLDARSARMTMEFPYFMEKRAPVTGAAARMDYRCRFQGASGPGGEDFVLTVSVPVSSLCPCSREISSYGAHNQRGSITMEVRSIAGGDGLPSMVWIEELVSVAESSASSPVYGLLKRPDEKFVTESSYDNPVFVEDMARNASVQLMSDPRIIWFRVTAESLESIHNHTAYAVYEWSRKDG
ncbi:MAG: GTP cyclohydrolase FolE2 [Candidatus Aegiribacteria sp. MLS_C]|nr:MAG: GTP cyclohydrolase FolE2 [Candidatus Aegiribacteria sp. MLS_C]